MTDQACHQLLLLPSLRFENRLIQSGVSCMIRSALVGLVLLSLVVRHGTASVVGRDTGKVLLHC